MSEIRIGRSEGAAIRLEGGRNQLQGRSLKSPERQPEGRPFRPADPAVSIIIPVYNMERYLRQCLDSVLVQTLREIEAICVDDGSTDSSPAILAEYAARDARVKVITQRNAGPGPARNAGIAAAAGEYIMFMDPDDFYPENATVEKLYAAIVKSGLQIARGKGSTVDPEGLPVKKQKRNVFSCWPPLGESSYRDLQTAAGYVLNIYARKLIVDNKIGFPDTRRFQDPPCLIEAMLKAEKFWQIGDVVYCHRRGYRRLDKKANGGWLAKEEQRGIDAAIRIARENDLEYLHDALLRMSGRSKPGLRVRAVQWLCQSGKGFVQAPTPPQLAALLDNPELIGEPLFLLLRRVLSAPGKIRKPLLATLSAKLLSECKNGRFSVSRFGFRRRVLLRWIIFMAGFRRACGIIRERRRK